MILKTNSEHSRNSKSLVQGFSNIFSCLPLNEFNNFKIPSVYFIYIKNSNWKGWPTAGMNYTMLPAVPRFSKYLGVMFYFILLLIFVFSRAYFHFSLRPRSSEEWLACQ